MIIQHFHLVFSFIIYLLSICCCVSEPVPTSGPFKTSLVSVKKCSDPFKPYAKNPTIIFHPSIQNMDGKTILDGNLTILKDTADVKMKIKSYVWRTEQWHQAHMFTNVNCHGLLLHLTFQATKIKYDKKNCKFFKGVYIFKNLDVNLVQHIWVSSQPYGRLLWRTEAFTNTEMFICNEFDTITEPAYFG